ncbi:MAG: hypothetical protein H0W90_10880 [Actinobacteria bacterium]|nr:hypothetical protein [Actinomycetota bacterium]
MAAARTALPVSDAVVLERLTARGSAATGVTALARELGVPISAIQRGRDRALAAKPSQEQQDARRKMERRDANRRRGSGHQATVPEPVTPEQRDRALAARLTARPAPEPVTIFRPTTWDFPSGLALQGMAVNMAAICHALKMRNLPRWDSIGQDANGQLIYDPAAVLFGRHLYALARYGEIATLQHEGRTEPMTRDGCYLILGPWDSPDMGTLRRLLNANRYDAQADRSWTSASCDPIPRPAVRTGYCSGSVTIGDGYGL